MFRRSMPEREHYHQPALPLESPPSQPSLRSKEAPPSRTPDPIREEFVFELTQRARLDLPEISLPEFRAILLWRDGKECDR